MPAGGGDDVPTGVAAPIAFVLHGPAFTVRACVCSMPYVRPLITCGVRHTPDGPVDADVDVIAYAATVAATPVRG